MLPDQTKPAWLLIRKELSIDELDGPDPSEEHILQLIAQRVEELINHDIDLLFSYLYRLDIDEQRVHYVLNHQSLIPAHLGIARLILDRQKARIASKEKYKQTKIKGWDSW